MIVIVTLVLTVAATPQHPTWGIGGTRGAEYSMAGTSGSAIGDSGATLALSGYSAPPSAFGAITGMLAADTFRLRRVRIVADIDTKNVTGGASPWLRIDGPSGPLVLDNGATNVVKGTASERREITLYVPVDATRLVFGLMLRGAGEATARGFRLIAHPAVAADAPLAPAAQRELDSAFAIVRSTRCGETQLRGQRSSRRYGRWPPAPDRQPRFTRRFVPCSRDSAIITVFL